MKGKLRDVGLASLGLGVTIKEKVRDLGRKLVKKGEAHEKRILSSPKEKFVAGAQFAGKEALAISKKSLGILERELKKLEAKTKKGVKKSVSPRKKSSRKKRR